MIRFHTEVDREGVTWVTAREFDRSVRGYAEREREGSRWGVAPRATQGVTAYYPTRARALSELRRALSERLEDWTARRMVAVARRARARREGRS